MMIFFGGNCRPFGATVPCGHEENGLPHQCEHWCGNDILFVTQSTDFVAESKTIMSLRGAAAPRKAATWQSASLQCEALRRPKADNFIAANYISHYKKQAQLPLCLLSFIR